ncbi:MAG: hypothetical protein H6728_13860 [Myxococcales bacterium]|nr:hypothetical protein [Myxococcales bacterium]
MFQRFGMRHVWLILLLALMGTSLHLVACVDEPYARLCESDDDCPSDETCWAGVACVSRSALEGSGEADSGSKCAPSEDLCNGSCVDLEKDDKNCGSCGHVCPTGQHCAANACVDP